MLSQTRNQRVGRIKNNSENCRIAVYTDLIISHPKESNQELYNYHRQHQQSIRHLCPPNTHNTRQGNQKYPRAPQDHPKDSLIPSNGQTPPQYGASHEFFLCRREPFPTLKIKEDIFQLSPMMQQQRKILNYIWIKASEDHV